MSYGNTDDADSGWWNYNDDKPSGGPAFSSAFTVFEYAGLALVATVVLAFVVTAIRDRNREEPENPPLR